MRTAFSPFLSLVGSVLFLCVLACGGPPTPTDVAGIYDLYSVRGTVRGPDPDQSIELKRDGTYVTSHLLRNGEYASSTDVFRIWEGEEGCFRIALGPEENPDPPPPGNICGDDWIWGARGSELATVYKRRQ